MAGVDGEGEHAVEDLAGLSYPGRAEARSMEVDDPLLDGHPVDVAELVAAEGGEDVDIEVRLVAGEGLGFEMRLGSEPPFGPLGEGGLRQAGVGPVAADEVSLDGGHKPVGVGLAGKALGSFPPVGSRYRTRQGLGRSGRFSMWVIRFDSPSGGDLVWSSPRMRWHPVFPGSR